MADSLWMSLMKSEYRRSTLQKRTNKTSASTQVLKGMAETS